MLKLIPSRRLGAIVHFRDQTEKPQQLSVAQSTMTKTSPSGERLSYVALGLVWPAVVALAFFVVEWKNLPPSLPLLIYAGLEVWVILLVVTVPAFAALWLARRFLFSRRGAPAPSVTRLFFLTSVIGSPLALVFLLSV